MNRVASVRDAIASARRADPRVRRRRRAADAADDGPRGARLALARSRGDRLVAQAALLRATGRSDGDAFAIAAGPTGWVRQDA